jgi:predicted N-acetyltransferase YhbS
MALTSISATSSATSEFSVRPLTLDDVAAGHCLTQQLNWPHTKQDWIFHVANGHGWVAIDDSGTVIGTSLIWFYGDNDATLGLVIVDNAFRGRGVANALMTHTLEAAGNRKIRLVATEMAVKLYENLGFASSKKITIAQRQGVIHSAKPLHANNGAIVRVASEQDYESILSLDLKASGMDRSKVIISLLSSSSSYVLEKGDNISGFVMVRESGRGKTFGPLLASNETDAKLLLSRALSEHTGFCRIDVPEDAEDLGLWLDQNGLPIIDSGLLMQNVNNDLFNQSNVKVYSLISQALL